jgi:RNA polymerase sigma factor (sigma-70 family)
VTIATEALRDHGSRAGTQVADDELVRRASAGAEDAWRHLVSRYEPLVRHTARRYRLGDAETADAVATTWLKLVENITTIRDGTRVAGWLATTVRRECLARVSHNRREQLVDRFLGANEPRQEIDMECRLTEEDDRRAIQRALARLSDRERRLALLLFSDASPSYRQVSTRLSIPLGTIGPTRSRILEKLRRILIDYESELTLAG